MLSLSDSQSKPRAKQFVSLPLNFPLNEIQTTLTPNLNFTMFSRASQCCCCLNFSFCRGGLAVPISKGRSISLCLRWVLKIWVNGHKIYLPYSQNAASFLLLLWNFFFLNQLLLETKAMFLNLRFLKELFF